MFKLVIAIVLVAVASAVPVQDGLKQSILDNLLPALRPDLFSIQNPILNRVTPFIKPIANELQTVINPSLQNFNNNANRIPVAGSLVTRCTNNILQCALNLLDNANVVPTG